MTRHERERRGTEAAPDRSRDLHSLQHVRGDLPGRRDHARRQQLRRRSGEVQLLHGVHLAVSDRLDRQLAHRAAGRRPTASTSSSRGTSCPARTDLGVEAPASGRCSRSMRPRRPTTRRRSSSTRTSSPIRCRGRRCRRGRPSHPYVNLYGHKAPVTATVAGNFRVTDARHRKRHASHRARLRQHAVPGARRPVDRHPAAGRRRATARPHHARQYSIASPRDGERAGLQQRVADGEARHQRLRRQCGRAASRRTTCAT